MKSALAIACLMLAACSHTSVERSSGYATVQTTRLSVGARPRVSEAAPSVDIQTMTTAEAPPSAGWNASSLPPPPQASPQSSRQSSRQAAPAPTPAPMIEPEERPGLGTVWGETLVSHVTDTVFERAATPPTVATLYYNDRAGIAAMADYAVRNVGAGYDALVAMDGGVTASLVDTAERPFEAMSIGGRIHVVGEVGQRYNIVLHNRTNRRLEVVGSVDGVDVIDGQPASLSKRGYILSPYSSLVIDGFRRSQDLVAAFRFGAVKQSYAARTSGDSNVGVIGLAIFAERPADVDDEVLRRRSAVPFDSRYARPPL
jgi:hypothetical protein